METFGKVEALFKNKSDLRDFTLKTSAIVMLFEASEGKTKVAGPSEVTPAEAETLGSIHEQRFRLLSFRDCI